jgi:two-component system, NarL family, sensor kinase
MDGPAGNGSTASLARLCAWLQRAGDEERQRLARRLHDSTAQTLAAASMNLTLVERSAAALAPAARTALARAQELLAASCREIGDLSYGLYPLLPGENGLASALRALAARPGGARLRPSVEVAAPLAPEIELSIYRLVEEALAGAFTDGEPVTAQIGSSGRTWVVVTLRGRARPAADRELTTLALRQRARALGGRLRIKHTRGEGTQGPQTLIEARLPVVFK